jgi:hypothetical protein
MDATWALLATALTTAAPPLSAATGVLVPPGAADVGRHSADGSETVTYYVKESYPAPNILALIQKALAGGGWKPVPGKEAPLYYSSSLDRGWLDVPGDRSSWLTRLWSSTWRDSAENEVSYTLTYTWPQGEHGLQPTYVSVLCIYRTKEQARRARAAIEGEMVRLKARVRQKDASPSETPCPN